MNSSIKELLLKHNVKLTKSLGQNFLIDKNAIKKIVDAADLNKTDLVVEIGAGIGNLTRELCTKGGKVLAVEIDRRLMPALYENLEGFSNVEIINKDILELDLNALVADHGFSSVKVVANLPYYITTPVIMKFLEEMPCADTLVFMVQKEVADRMTARPGSQDYGALSVAVQFYSTPERICNVSPHCFIPQPSVASTVVRLVKNRVPPVVLIDREMFFKTVRAAFCQRRKKITNAIFNSGEFTFTREEIKEMLKNLGIDENRRAETLSILQFAHIANSFSQKNC